MSLVSIMNKLYSQTQKITELWVWESCFFHIEKIPGKNRLFLPDFPEDWVWILIAFYIGPINLILIEKH